MKYKKSPINKLTLNSEYQLLSNKIYDMEYGYALFYSLMTNGIIKNYIIDSGATINNFLRGKSAKTLGFDYNIDNPPPAQSGDYERYLECLETEKYYIDLGVTAPLLNTTYPPITKAYIKDLINIDRAFRLSKSWNKKSRVLFRGEQNLKSINNNCILSTSTDINEANGFSNSVLLEISVDSHFPALNISEIQRSFSHEKEVILPPCKVEIANAEKYYNGKKVVKVSLTPLSLAKVFLNRMENLPADYPKAYQNDPFYQFEEAKNMLKRYIKTEVDKHIVRMSKIRSIKEIDDPIREDKNSSSSRGKSKKSQSSAEEKSDEEPKN